MSGHITMKFVKILISNIHKQQIRVLYEFVCPLREGISNNNNSNTTCNGFINATLLR